MADAPPSEISREHLLAYQLLEKERELAELRLKYHSLEKQIFTAQLTVASAKYQELYHLGPHDKIKPDGTITRHPAPEPPKVG